MRRTIVLCALLAWITATFVVPAGFAAEEGDKIDWKDVQRRYREHYQSDDALKRMLALEAFLGADDPRSAKLLLVHLLQDKAPLVMLQAADILATYKSDKAVKLVADAASAPQQQEERRFLLVETLGRMQNPPLVLKALLGFAALKDKQYILLALKGFEQQRTPDPKVIQLLKFYAMEGQDYPLRLTAVRALAQMPHKDAVPLLIEAAATEGRIRETAIKGLKLLTGEAFGMNPETWKNFQSFQKRRERIGHAMS